MRKAIIITAYFEHDTDIKSMLGDGTYVICTDGGFDIAKFQGIKPDLLIGDFDSIISFLPENVEIKRFDPEKDYTDLDLAIKTARDANFDELTILGGMGGRLDHTVANIQLLTRYSRSFESLTMLDGRNKCFVLDSRHSRSLTLPAEENSYFSVLSLTEKTTGVSIKGAKYTLDDYTLTYDFPLGVSNEFVKKNTVISIKDGILLIVISKM